MELKRLQSNLFIESFHAFERCRAVKVSWKSRRALVLLPLDFKAFPLSRQPQRKSVDPLTTPLLVQPSWSLAQGSWPVAAGTSCTVVSALPGPSDSLASQNTYCK
jgi:hypothetical protein